MSPSSSQIPMKSKGGDFILEGKVKHQKLIAPKGLAFSTNSMKFIPTFP